MDKNQENWQRMMSSEVPDTTIRTVPTNEVTTEEIKKVVSEINLNPLSPLLLDSHLN